MKLGDFAPRLAKARDEHNEQAEKDLQLQVEYIRERLALIKQANKRQEDLRQASSRLQQSASNRMYADVTRARTELREVRMQLARLETRHAREMRRLR